MIKERSDFFQNAKFFPILNIYNWPDDQYVQICLNSKFNAILQPVVRKWIIRCLKMTCFCPIVQCMLLVSMIRLMLLSSVLVYLFCHVVHVLVNMYQRFWVSSLPFFFILCNLYLMKFLFTSTFFLSLDFSFYFGLYLCFSFVSCFLSLLFRCVLASP